MTTKPRATRAFPPLPDPPEREPEDITSFDHLTKNGGAHHLAQHFGHPDITVVGGERYIIREPDTPAADRRFPDLLIAFDANPEAYQDSNSYVISEQGKPPDFVMEIASQSTGQEDTGNKRTWASRNTGGSTRPEDSTEAASRETSCWTAGMNR